MRKSKVLGGRNSVAQSLTSAAKRLTGDIAKRRGAGVCSWTYISKATKRAQSEQVGQITLLSESHTFCVPTIDTAVCIELDHKVVSIMCP